MKVLRKVKILEISMTTLVAGKVATVVDSMFTVKINYLPFRGSILMRFKMSKPHNSFYLPFTILLILLQINERLKSSYFFYSINPLSEQKKKKSFKASRSLPGHASVILARAPAPLHCTVSIHVTCVYVYRYHCNVYTMYKFNLYMYQKSFDLPDVTHIRSRICE